jgi:hypothetical protein
MCAEMFLDRTYFDEISSTEALQTGDLFWFGPYKPDIPLDKFEFDYRDGTLINARDFPVKHVAIHTGEYTANGQRPLLLHSTYKLNNVVWPLDTFQEQPRYQRIYGITRYSGRLLTGQTVQKPPILART